MRQCWGEGMSESEKIKVFKKGEIVRTIDPNLNPDFHKVRIIAISIFVDMYICGCLFTGARVLLNEHQLEKFELTPFEKAILDEL